MRRGLTKRGGALAWTGGGRWGVRVFIVLSEMHDADVLEQTIWSGVERMTSLSAARRRRNEVLANGARAVVVRWDRYCEPAHRWAHTFVGFSIAIRYR